MDFGLIPVLEYCSGLNSAIFTEWDSIQCSCTALVLNSTVIAFKLYLWILDSFQYSSTVLVLIQLYSLNETQFSICVLLWSLSGLKYSHIYWIGHIPASVYCFCLISTIFTVWESIWCFYTDLTWIHLTSVVLAFIFVI